jgi:Tfp pilus assembly protein PilO
MKNKLIFILAFVFLTLMLSRQYIFAPYQQAKANLENAIKEENAKDSLVKEIIKSNQPLQAYLRRLSPTSDSAWMVKDFYSMANSAEVKILSVDPQGKQEREGFIFIPATLRLNCTYHNLGKFLSLVESSQTFLKVNNLQVSLPYGGRGQENLLDVSMTLETLYFKK